MAMLKLNYLGAAGVRKLVAPESVSGADPEPSSSEDEGHVGIYVASQDEAEILGDDGGGAGNRKRVGTEHGYDFAARRHDSARGGNGLGVGSCI
jgi:hypothetical protein